MIIVLARAGDLDSALAHGLRPLERNVALLVDAHEALILHAKDATNNASNMMILFREAVEAEVEKNLHTYNGIISKLTQTQKADNALESFQKMKTQGATPMSITCGALIGVCTRVGDCQSCELLFSEMVRQLPFLNFELSYK